MPIIELRDYNTDIFTRDEIVLATTISKHVCAKIKEIDRKEIPKNIKINSLGIISNQLALKVTIEYNVNTLTYGYGRMISLHVSDGLFNSLKDKVNMEIYGSAKRDDPYLDYSYLIFATTKKVEVKVTQNKSEIYMAKYNEMEKALIRTIHKGVGRLSAFANIIVGYDTKLGVMYYDESVINLGKGHKGCVSILEQVYIDFIAKLKNDGRYCPINVPISKEKTAIGWRDKERRYVNKVSFLTILNAIGRIDCEESVKSTQQPKDVAMSSNTPAAITISAEAKSMMEFIVEKCEMMIKLYDTIVDPYITVGYRKDDVLILTMRSAGIENINKQIVFAKSNSDVTTFIQIFKKVTGGIPIDTGSINDPLHVYYFNFNYHDLVNTIKSCNCDAIDIPIGPFHEVSGVKLKKTKQTFEKYTREILVAMISLNIFIHNHHFEIDTIEDVETGTLEIVIKDNIKNIKNKLTYYITSLEYNFELTANNYYKLSKSELAPIHNAYEHIHKFVTEMLKAGQTKEEIYRIINVIASKDIHEFAKVLTSIDMSTFSGIVK